MKKYAFAITVSLLLVAGGFFAVFSEANAALPQNQSNFAINLQPSFSPPQHGVLVVNAIATITNDVDSGYNGYWAIDDYTLHIQIWRASNSSFYLVLATEGKSTTYAGVPSPGGTGELEGGTGTASMHGFVAFWIVGGTLNSAPTADEVAVRTMGYIGMFNYGGSQSNLGPYGKGSAAPSPVYWPSVYVTGGTDSVGFFYYFYEYQGQTWVDASSVPPVDSGNILVS